MTPGGGFRPQIAQIPQMGFLRASALLDAGELCD